MSAFTMSESVAHHTNPIANSSHSLKNLDFIDGLRGVAILMTIFFHVTLAVGNINDFKEMRILMKHFSRGVQLFFIVSAFTLFRSYEIRKAYDKKPIVSFYIRRFFRIMPLWWIAVLLYYVIQSEGHSYFDVWATAFMFFGFYKEMQTMALIPVGWSLFVEEIFYLIFPLLIKSITGFKASIIHLVLSILVAKLWFSFGIALNYDSFFIGTFPLANFYSFLLGISLYFVYKKIEKTNFSSHSFAKLFWLDFLCVICFLGIFYTDRINGTLLLIPLIVASSCTNSLTARVLNLSLLKIFGRYCYSIYLLHPIIISQIKNINSGFIDNIQISESNFYGWSLCMFLVVSLISLLFGAVSFHFLELKFINLGRKVISNLGL